MRILLLQYLKFDDGVQGNPRRHAAGDVDRQIVAVPFVMGRALLLSFIVDCGTDGIKNDSIRF